MNRSITRNILPDFNSKVGYGFYLTTTNTVSAWNVAEGAIQENCSNEKSHQNQKKCAWGYKHFLVPFPETFLNRTPIKCKIWVNKGLTGAKGSEMF